MLYHYTALNALLGICRNRKLVFWATRYNCLNDPLEFAMYKKLQSYAKEFCLDNGLPYDADFEVHPYIISFCKKRDDLTMWRLYGSEGNGIMLSLDYEVLEKSHFAVTTDNTGQQKRLHNDYLMPVEYYNEDTELEKYNLCLEHFVAKYSLDAQDALLTTCAFIKRDDYEIKGEYRYARMNYNGFEANGPENMIDYSEMGMDVLYRTRGNSIVPYIEVELPTNVLKEIILGYQMDDSSVEQLKNVLQNRGYCDVVIRFSKFTQRSPLPIALL